jgi:uncharacterized metal-binding protein YceD (DUF177 family)
MDTFEQYVIPIKALDKGVHIFDFELDERFFQHFEASPIEESDLKINVVLDKRETMILLAVEVKGTMQTACDRCMEAIALPLHQSHDLVIKYGPEGESGDVVYIDPEEPSFQLAPYLYEFSCLTIPMVRVYDCASDENAPCNDEVLEILEEAKESESEGNTELGDQLKNLNINLDK